jgi:hypothetical protein
MKVASGKTPQHKTLSTAGKCSKMLVNPETEPSLVIDPPYPYTENTIRG